MNVKEIIGKHPIIFKMLTHLYNKILGNNKIKMGKKNHINIGIAIMKQSSIRISGVNNTIIIEDLSRLEKCQIDIIGNNCTLIIKRRCYLGKAELWLQHNGSSIVMGEHVTIHGPTHIASTEGCKISIGDDCMFANSIQIRNGDSHSIYCGNQRINNAQDVFIGNHVWICTDTVLLKGSSIPDNCIVGAKSLVTTKFNEDYTIIAGNPACIKKRNIYWKREIDMPH